MSRDRFFNFTPPSPSVDSFVARVPSGITSAEALLLVLYERVMFPGYFGFNWNALSDCLRDLHWISLREVVIWHADLPTLPLEDLRVYLDVLAESVASWSPGEAHSLTVVFPNDTRSLIASLG